MDTRYLYVMGAESGVGKSAVCQGILAQLLVCGYPPSQLAYIKPVTQCVEIQSISRFCNKTKIMHVDIGAVVFRNGFSRDFIDGLTKGSDELMSKVLASIFDIGRDKSLVIIDGVGDPSAGSVVGVSNVDVAAALRSRVIFVGKSGIGAAIDNTVLCASFIQNKGITEIGLIYNKIPLEYLCDVKRYVTKRISELLPNATPLGFIGTEQVLASDLDNNSSSAIANWFSRSVNPRFLLHDWLGLEELT